MTLFEYDLLVKEEGYPVLAGVDEAGRGPLAGPVFACALIMPEDPIIEGINDSKKLTEKKREKLYEEIMATAISVSVAAIDEQTIDQINILNATMLAMSKAIEGLTLSPNLSLIDGNCNKGIHVPSRCVIGGDALSYHIAAASIVAKVSRDRFILSKAKDYPEYGFEKHKGYGTKVHREALLTYGPCELHRRTFLKNILKVGE